MERIFISYKRANKDKVFTLVDKIERQLGIKCWVDLDGIESSAQFASVICRAIDQSDVVLFMHSYVHLSIDFEKDWTIKELNYAQMKNKRVVLVKLDDTPLDNIFLLEYGSKNNIDSNDPLQFAILLNNLRFWLNILEEPKYSAGVPNSVNLKVLTNLDCNVLIDGENKGIAVADSIMKIPLPVGEYIAEFLSTEDFSDAISKEIVLTHDKIEKIDLLSFKHLTPYISNNKIGFANKYTQAIIIPCKYDFVGTFSEGLAVVQQNGKYGFIDKSGKVVVTCKYDDAVSFNEGLAAVELNGKYGFIDKSGELVIPSKYDYAIPFSEGLAEVFLNRKGGFIDKSGREVIPCKYDISYSFSEGLAAVKFINGKFGFIDKSGEVVIPSKYDNAISFNEGLAAVELNGKWGFIDKSGKEAIPCKYDNFYSFYEGLAAVELNGKWGFIDKTGKEVIPFKYNNVDIFREGLAAVELNGKWGFIDKFGKVVVPYEYDGAYSFREGLAAVELNGKSGFIDRFGKEVIPIKYDNADSFDGGLASIGANFDGYIDIFGNELLKN